MRDYQNNKILILGGTRFFGKSIFEMFKANGFVIFTASNKKSVGYDDHYLIDRNNSEDLNRLAENCFDVVIDMLCYNPLSAKKVCDAFRGKCRKFVFISSGDVYSLNFKLNRQYNEDEFYLDYDVSYLNDSKWNDIEFNKRNYVLGKYLAEQVFETDPFFSPISLILRLSNVVSLECDPTLRFKRLYDAAKNGDIIGPIDVQSSFIHYNEVKYILFEMIKQEVTSGIYNISTLDNTLIFELYTFIQKAIYPQKEFIKVDSHLPSENLIISPRSCSLDSSKLYRTIDYNPLFYKNLLTEIAE